MGNKDPFMKKDGSQKDEFLEFDGKSSGSDKSRMLLMILLLGGLGAGAAFYFLGDGAQDFLGMGTATDTEMNTPPEVRAQQEPVNTMHTSSQRVATPSANTGEPNSAEMQGTGTPPAGDLAEMGSVDDVSFPNEMQKGQTSAEPKAEMHKGSVGSGSIVVKAPNPGATWAYDEGAFRPEFIWEGEPTVWISFSKNPNMNPVEYKDKATGNRYAMRRLSPGMWYWQMSNQSGKSEIRSFSITPPVKREIAIVNPVNGGKLPEMNSKIMWKGDQNISFYRVEISDKGWANPNYRFATTGTEMHVKNLSKGNYEMRLGAFSEVSGRWEYTTPIKVSVQ